MSDVWIAIDKTTSRIIGFGSQGLAKTKANVHEKLSGNEVKLRLLKIGMIIYEG